MTFQDIVLKQEEVFVSGDKNQKLFWIIFLSGIAIGLLLGLLICVLEGNFKDYWLGFIIFPLFCGLAFAGFGAGISSSKSCLVNKVYETHYTVEAETFYKSDFTRDYEIVSQDGRLLVVKAVIK